ncbi:unnamed protein product [Gongylonema pulchrum]|uniref:WD_REPEATS_REGION domain-containing protein n=1 Tax=Gongylonema pulchrum TaxID=637853 RepID=A0A183DBU7_9BILA|nr:unnamed protein product [Gongylonema pulchrum]
MMMTMMRRMMMTMNSIILAMGKVNKKRLVEILISFAIVCKTEKKVSALAFDQQGTKFVTGGYDYLVNLFEFQKMDLSLRSSRELMPCERLVFIFFGA